MKRIFSTLLVKSTGFVFLFCASLALAQPDTVWTRTYGGDAYDVFNDVEPTPDGGFIMVGAKADSTGQTDAWVVKTDSLGAMEWERTLGDSLDDEAYQIKLTVDGDYIVVVSWFHALVPPLIDYCLWKLDSEGNTEWHRLYGGSWTDYSRCLVVDMNGDYWVGGYSTSFSNGGRDFWLLHCNADGDSLWSDFYGGEGNESIFSMQLTHDNGFIIAGYTSSFGAGSEDMWLLRLDANGDSLWSRTFGGGALDEGRAVLATSDGGFVIGGWTNSFGPGFDNAYIVKVDAEGDFLWDGVYGSSEVLQTWIHGMDETSDGGIVAAGKSYNFGDGRAWLLRLSSAGDSLWQQRWTTDFHSYGYSVQTLSDNSFVIVGLTSYQHNDFTGDAWLLKTEHDPLPTDEFFRPIVSNIHVNIFPNPVNGMATINLSLPYSGLTDIVLFNLLGQKISVLQSEFFSSGTHQIRLDVSPFPSGTYFLSLHSGTHIENVPLIVLR